MLCHRPTRKQRMISFAKIQNLSYITILTYFISVNFKNSPLNHKSSEQPKAAQNGFCSNTHIVITVANFKQRYLFNCSVFQPFTRYRNSFYCPILPLFETLTLLLISRIYCIFASEFLF